MKELFVFAGYLGGFLLFFWMIVFVLERLLKKKVKIPAVNIGRYDGKEVIPVIVAAVKAYEQNVGREVKRVAVERVVYKRKEGEISFWKLSGRATKILKREVE